MPCHNQLDTVIIVAKEDWDHKRYFMLMPVASLWTATFPNLYETMLPSMPCHAYLDVDCPAAMHTANFTELLQARCEAVAAQVFSATIHKFVVLTSHAPDGTRLSYHIVCHLQDSSTGRALLFKNNMAAAGFAQRVAEGLPQPSVIDTKVRTSPASGRCGCWAIANTPGQERPFLLVTPHTPGDTLCCPRPPPADAVLLENHRRLAPAPAPTGQAPARRTQHTPHSTPAAISKESTSRQQ